MTSHKIIVSLLIALLIIPAYAKPGKKKKQKAVKPYPVSICYVREMEYIPELNGWEACSKDDYVEEVTNALLEWKKVRPWVEKRVTPKKAKRLSQWAQKEMEKYTRVPPLTRIKLIPVRFNKDHRMIVLEGTIDTLPAHSPIITRWLKIFLIYDTINKQIIRATITIKGEILE